MGIVDPAADPTAETRYLDRVRRLAFEGLQGVSADVYLFGSRARGTAARHSDVDIAVDPRGSLPPGTLQRLREAYEESTIPWIVDVVNLADCEAGFRERVLREGTKWIDCGNG